MNCENCYHYKICSMFAKKFEQHARVNFFSFLFFQTICKDFKDKSRIVELPVSVGQQVWFVRNGKIEETIVEKVVLKHRGLHIKLGCNAMYETSCNSIGKTVFLTREEAEEALRKEREK